MIQYENINDKLIRCYSDSNFFIRVVNTEDLYEEAVYPVTANYDFEETDIEIKKEIDYKELAEHYKTLLDTISGE